MLNVHPLKAIRRIDLRFGPMNDVKRQDRKPSMVESFETKSREADEFLVEAGAVCWATGIYVTTVPKASLQPCLEHTWFSTVDLWMDSDLTTS